MLDQKKILKGVEELHNKAKAIGSGSIKVGKEIYNLQFDGRNWVSTAPDGEEKNWNTRKITVAKKWVKEYYG